MDTIMKDIQQITIDCVTAARFLGRTGSHSYLLLEEDYTLGITYYSP
jgi:hypothetical protein